MEIHIVGAGPTGLTVAWELLDKGHVVHIYDKKPAAGGSWWEPNIMERDLHAHRVVFKDTFVNTNKLFSEMGISWDEIFYPMVTTPPSPVSLSIRDYFTLTSLAFRVTLQPKKYSKLTVKESIGKLSEQGEKLVKSATHIIDGVHWNMMTAYEFVKTFDFVGLSRPHTQRVSGKVMGDKMRDALIKKGATFHFEKELVDVEYGDGFVATFNDNTVVNRGMLILCLDNRQALPFIKNNWPEGTHKTIKSSAYECINVLLDYDEPISLPSYLDISMNTEWSLIPTVLSDGKTVSCGLVRLTKEVIKTNPDMLKAKVLKQLGLPEPRNIRIGWGSEWNGDRWVFDQSSGIISKYGHVPFFGKNKHVALCGMMSKRKVPFASMEAAVEVGKIFCHETFKTRGPTYPILLSEIILIILILIFIVLKNKINIKL